MGEEVGGEGAEQRTAVRAVSPRDLRTVDLIAQRLRLTLAEVLGRDRSVEMFTHGELVDRVTWHLDRSDPSRQADVFVAIGAEGTVVGHTMVRAEFGEPTGPAPVGLFATTYVIPGARRSGVASMLLVRGEQWMREHGLWTAVTFTDPSNTKLRALYTRHGYVWEQLDTAWARACKTLE